MSAPPRERLPMLTKYQRDTKEAALSFLTLCRDRAREKGLHDEADVMTRRIKELWLELNAREP